MTPGRTWNEETLSENPVVALLRRLGYTYVHPGTLEQERDSLRDTVLHGRLAAALRRLNPWIDDDNLQRAIKQITRVGASNLTEAGRQNHTTLTYGAEVEQSTGPGGRGRKKSRLVRYFDFDTPMNNELLFTRQYKVLGSKKHIIPDVVVFLNGIPVVVIECKSPTIGDVWRNDAIKQLRRYQEADDSWRGEGAPKLFETVQLVVGTCDQRAVYGTVGTPRRYFFEWKTAYPRDEAALAKLAGRTPTDQDRLLAGLLDPANLLDVIRNFQVFQVEKGRVVRKVCRYKQFIAVNESIARSTKKGPAQTRGGVVWHTQGSGKSLTMVWLALKLRRDTTLDNPTIVIVTDRRDLDRQITDTFLDCGFPNPERAEKIKELRALLSGAAGQGKTVMTTIQKFQEGADAATRAAKKTAKKKARRHRASESVDHPVFTEAENVFVLVDEAHRTQYRDLGTNLRTALPNAAFLGFTGTPIDKKDKSTLRTFGPYIDQYTIEQAVLDGATVPIYYASRLPELRIIGQRLDTIFDRVFADRSDKEREAIKKRYATAGAIAAAPKRIEAICLDIIEHFTESIAPNEFKAQIVAVSREAAVIYQEALVRLHAPESAVIISGAHNDEAMIAKWTLKKEDRDREIERFKDQASDLKILVVCDMLLTGFDAPCEQVMYLDSPLREHNLLQAIARVNRLAENKSHGLIIDYWGVAEDLESALAIFSPKDIQGSLERQDSEVPLLQARHQAAMGFFARVADKDDLHVCIAVIEPEDVRSEFDLAFRKFARSMDMLLPDPRAKKYRGDLKWLGQIRQAARARFHDDALDIRDCGAKVRKLIEDAVQADGVRVLVEAVPLFSTTFDEQIEALHGDEAKASHMEHAIRHEIHVKLEESPAFYTSLKEKLEELIRLREEGRISAAEQIELFKKQCMDPLAGREEVAASHGLSDRAYAVHGVLEGAWAVTAEDAPALDTELSVKIDEALAPLLEITGWREKDDIKRKMRRQIKKRLRDEAGMTNDAAGKIAAVIVRLMEARR